MAVWMEGPLAKQNPSAPHLYSVRHFVLDGRGLRFRGAQRSDDEPPAEHIIHMDDQANEVEMLAPGHGDPSVAALDGADFQLVKRDGLCLRLRARSSPDAFRWLLALSQASGVPVALPDDRESWQPLPSGWDERPVEATGQTYYHNTKTHAEQWARPSVGAGSPRAAERAIAAAPQRDSKALAAAGDAARLDAEIREMKAARRRRKWGGGGGPSEAVAVERGTHVADGGGPGDVSNLQQQAEVNRRGLELQASIADLSSKRQARRQRRRDERKQELWAGTSRRETSAEEAPSSAQAASDSEFASLSSEERVAAQMARLLHAAFPTEDAHGRCIEQITGSRRGTAMLRRQVGSQPADANASQSHPPAPVPTFADGAFVAAAIVDQPASGKPAAHPIGGVSNGPAAAALRAELERLRPSELRRRAVRARVPASLLGEAHDSTDPKAKIITLLVHYESQAMSSTGLQAATGAGEPAVNEAEPEAEDEAELVTLRPSELRRYDLKKDGFCTEDVGLCTKNDEICTFGGGHSPLEYSDRDLMKLKTARARSMR